MKFVVISEKDLKENGEETHALLDEGGVAYERGRIPAGQRGHGRQRTGHHAARRAGMLLPAKYRQTKNIAKIRMVIKTLNALISKPKIVNKKSGK